MTGLFKVFSHLSVYPRMSIMRVKSLDVVALLLLLLFRLDFSYEAKSLDVCFYLRGYHAVVFFAFSFVCVQCFSASLFFELMYTVSFVQFHQDSVHSTPF